MEMKSNTKLTNAIALAIGLAIPGVAAAKDITLGILPAGMDTFGTALGRGFTEEAEKLGARVVMVDSKWSVERMGNAIDDLIAQQVDGVAFAAMDGIVAMSWVEKLNAANIPVVAPSTGVGDVMAHEATWVYPGLYAYVNHDDTLSGKISAELAIPALPKDRKAKIAVINGSPGIAVAVQRLKGFTDALDAAGADYEIVTDQPTDMSPEEGESVCQNVLTATPDVDVFFTQADPLAIGCAHAITATGSKALVFSTAGGMKTSNDLIASGEIAGTTCVKPETMGRLAARALYEAATSPKPAGQYITYQLAPVTKETVANCPPEW
jgi:ribose transport system substrate-binding protein